MHHTTHGTQALHAPYDARTTRPTFTVSFFLFCFVLFLWHREYQIYLDKLTIRQINNGEAREAFAQYVDRMRAFSKNWAARNAMTLVCCWGLGCLLPISYS